MVLLLTWEISNLKSLCCHKSDFDIYAKWHFLAIGPCDGLSVTLKGLAAKASLHRPYNKQIRTARHLFFYTQENVSNIHFIYLSMDEWSNEMNILEDRFSNSSSVVGIKKLHIFIPVSHEDFASENSVQSEKDWELEFQEKYRFPKY